MTRQIILLDKILYYEESYYIAYVKNYYLQNELIRILKEIGDEVVEWNDTLMFPETSLFNLEMHKPEIIFEVIPDA